MAILGFFANTLDLALAAAPWLVLGLVVAGLIKAWLPTQALARHLSSNDARAVATASLIGAPLPLCSCGVLPAAFALRRSGASKPATVSFLISTPETGVDSIAVSYVLLGPVFAIVRPVAAVFSALATGLAVARLAPERPMAAGQVEATDLFAAEADACGDCCEAGATVADVKFGVLQRAGTGLRYAFSDLMDDLALWLAAGILVAGAIVTIVPPDLLAAWAQGPVAMFVVLAVSVPMYVCATASTPIALALLYAGVSPGTALVFLLAGPATNFAGLALIGRELGMRTMMVYLLGLSVCAIGAGLLLDVFWPALGGERTIALAAGDWSEATPLWLAGPSLLLLIAFALRPMRRIIFNRIGAVVPEHG